MFTFASVCPENPLSLPPAPLPPEVGEVHLFREQTKAEGEGGKGGEGGVTQVTFHKGKNLGGKRSTSEVPGPGILISGARKVPLAFAAYI